MKLLFLKSIRTSTERLEGLKQIDPTLDLGHGLSVDSFTAKIATVQQELNDYNGLKSALTAKRSLLRKLDSDLKDMRELVRVAVAAMYGKDSIEYVKVGGVRKSETKRRLSSGNNQSSPDSDSEI
jgi:hypothetical protein